MLPDSNNRPTSAGQQSVRLGISFNVASELGLPPIAIGGWHAAVLGAAMPEAAIDENGDLAPREHNVGLAAKARQRREVDPKSVTRGV